MGLGALAMPADPAAVQRHGLRVQAVVLFGADDARRDGHADHVRLGGDLHELLDGHHLQRQHLLRRGQLRICRMCIIMCICCVLDVNSHEKLTLKIKKI